MTNKQLIASILSVFTLFSCNPGKDKEQEKEKSKTLTYQETINYVNEHALDIPNKPSSGYIEFEFDSSKSFSESSIKLLGGNTTSTSGSNDISQDNINAWHDNLELIQFENKEEVILGISKTNFGKYFAEEHKDEFTYKLEDSNLIITFIINEDNNKYNLVRTFNSNLSLAKFTLEVSTKFKGFKATQTFSY